MSVWARDEQRRLVRVTPQGHTEESTVRRLFQENPTPQMDNPGNQQTLFNPNDQGLTGNPQRPYDKEMVWHRRQPRRQEGEMLIFSKINIELPLPLYPMWKEPFGRLCRTITNSCTRLPKEANQFLMKSEMIRLLPVYQGVDSKSPYSFMRDFEDVCSAFLSTRSPLYIICMVLFPISPKEKAKIWFHSLAPNSIFTWEDKRNEFLNKFFPPARTNALM